MKKIVLVLVVLGIFMMPAALAKPEYLDVFNSTYPTAVDSRIDNCALCHINGVPGGPRNPYGTDFENILISDGLDPANANDTESLKALKAIESNDSDGDGFTNIVEIQNLTFPGNASDFPKAVETGKTGTFNITGFKLNGSDENNSGIADWEIMLTDNQGVQVANTTTESDGSYTFPNLANGTYNVTEGTRTGWVSVSPATQEIVIDNEDEPDVNFTNMLAPATGTTFNISGFKLNGTENTENAVGIENWNIMLFDDQGNQIQNTTTESDGSYVFTNLTNGTYNVTEGLQEGWTNVTNMTQQVVIDNEDETDVNFTNSMTTGPLMITNESPVSPFVSAANEAVTFEIKLNQNANVTWNLDGTDVSSDEDVMFSDYTNSNASIGDHILDAMASNQNGQDSFEWNWTVQNAAITVENVGVITGQVFNDRNHNKKKDKHEKGISGVKVELKGADPDNKDVKLSTKTNKAGRYNFKNLTVGHYRVKVGHKKGFVPTTRTNRGVNLTIDVPKKNINFGERQHKT